MSDKVKLRVKLDDIFQKVSNIVTSWSGTLSDTKYPSEKLVKNSLDLKSDTGHTHKNTVKTVISSGSLNNYTTTGWYSYTTTNANNNVVTDVPVKVGAVMEVIDDYGDGKYVTQTVYPLPNTKASHIYYRMKYDAQGWGDWIRIDGQDKSDSTHTHGNLSNDGKISTSNSDTFQYFVGVGNSTNSLYKAYNLRADKVKDINEHTNISTSANATQDTINTAIDSALNNKIDKGNIQGGVNLLGQWISYTNAGAGAVVTKQNEVLFHGDEVVRINNSSISDTTKYTDMYWETPYNEFGYNDVFTFSFYAKGTNNAQIKTYFYGESGYITVKRLSSNSTVSGNNTESSSFNDGVTTFALGSDWQFYTVTYKLNSTGTTTAIKKPVIRVFGGTDCYVSCAKLERGFNATDFNNGTGIKSIKIEATSARTKDLNNYTKTGFYYNSLNTDCAYISNLPVSNKAFFLTVENWGASTQYLKQTCTVYSPVETYVRVKNAGTWGAWKKLISVDDASSSKGLVDDPYNGLVGTSTKYAREDHAHGKLYHWSTGDVTSATYVDLLEFTMTQSWQDRPITFAVTRRAKDRHYYVSIRFSNTDITSSTYTVQSFKVWGDESAQTFYLRKVEDNKYRLCAYKTANDSYILYDMVCLTEGITVTKIPSADGNYGTTAPSGSAPNLYTSTQIGVPDTDVTWNGVATINSVSPILMGVGEDFNANRLAYFPSERISIQYSTDGGSTWSNYSSIGVENKQRLCMNGYTAYLGNNSTTDRTKNRLRITFDVGDLNSNSVLYMITRKIAVYTGTNNATGFTCQLQTQTYTQYNSNVETFSNYGSSFTLGGNSGWNSYPISFTLGGNSGSQTNSSSTRIKALRLVFTQTGGTGNGLVSRIRLYGETAYRTPSNYSNNGHIYYADVNQNTIFPGKIIKDGGTSNEKLLANGDVQNASQISYGTVDGSSTSTVFTATVDGVKELVDGTTVMLKNGVVTSAEGFTLNVNGLGAKPVYSNLASATRDTTIFNINYTMLFTYDSTRVSGGCWICYRGYDSNTNTIGYQVRTNSTKYKASDKGYAYRIWLQTADEGKFMPVNTSSATNGTTNLSSSMNTRKFLLGGDIRYYSTNATTNANADLTATTMWQQYTFPLGYSFNNTSSALSLTVSKPVYMVCTGEGNGLGKLASPYYTQTLPTSADGKLYILLGYMYSATNLEMTLEHPIFEYKNGSIGLWSSNNHSHGNLTNDGRIGSTSGKLIVTGSSGTIKATDYYKYNVTAPQYNNNGTIVTDTYNVKIDTTIPIECSCKDADGAVVTGKTLTLYKNGENIGTAVTDSYGVATWNVLCDTWGIIDFDVEDSHCQILVDGWKYVIGSTSSSYAVMRNKNRARFILNGWTQTYSMNTTWATFGPDYASTVKPQTYIILTNSQASAYFRVNKDGSISMRTVTGTLASGTQHYGEIEWSLN